MLDTHRKSQVVNVNQLYLRRNAIATQDDYLIPEPSWESIFYDVGKQGYKPLKVSSKPREKSPQLLYRTQIFLTSEEITHGREVYGFLDLLGDLGGVTEVIMLVFGFFLFPISEHSYVI